jgi:hypothetical protein
MNTAWLSTRTALSQRYSSVAETAIDFVTVAARLEAAPFQTGVFRRSYSL